MIPDTIQKEHLLQAIAEIDREGVPARQQSRRYDLFYNGRPYPPKRVVRIAYRLTTSPATGLVAGVKEINDFLTKRGFTIVFKPAAMPPEEERAIEYSEWVLQQLLAYRETHPDFYFLTRTNKKRDLLEAGHWLPGTSYLHVALAYAKSDDHSTKRVGFTVDFSRPDYPHAAFIVLFKRERRMKVVAFYRELLERLAPYGMQAETPNRFVLSYGEDVLEAMNLFLERDVPVFQALLHEYDLKKTLGVSPKSFTDKLANVLLVHETDTEYKESRLARLCWNTNGWVMPSGPSGKSDAQTSLEGRSVFGLEEWLLDLDKLPDDGYHYGFLPPATQERPVYIGKKYDVRLYTQNSLDEQHYWIGELTSVEAIDRAKSAAVERVYGGKGWLDAMGEQLTGLGLDPGLLVQPKAAGTLFNVRFLPEDAYVYKELIPFSRQEETEMRNGHYAFLKTSGRRSESTVGFKFRASAPPTDMPETIVRRFAHREVEHPHWHGKIQEGLYQWLKVQHGAERVASEQPTGAGGSRIDLVVRTGPNEYTFYEIKTFNSLMICIRTAIGQLMEYAFFPTGCQASQLVIVSHHRPEESALRYLENLRDRTGLPIYYGYFNLASGQLEM